MAFQANMKMQFTKTKMCKFELIGCCLKGESCQFAHDAKELQALPDLSRTKLCPTYIKKGSCDIPGCTFAHNKSEIRATHVFHKTKMCRFFPLGTCQRGSSCTFAHSPHELHSPDVPKLDEFDEKADATSSMLLASHKEDNLVPAISLLLDRLGDPQAAAKSFTSEMMEAEIETQCSDSLGHADGTSTPTSSEDDQLIEEAINAHQPSKIIQLYPFVETVQKLNPQESRMTVRPPPGLELYNESDSLPIADMRAHLSQDAFALQKQKNSCQADSSKLDSMWQDIWETEI